MVLNLKLGKYKKNVRLIKQQMKILHYLCKTNNTNYPNKLHLNKLK